VRPRLQVTGVGHGDDLPGPDHVAFVNEKARDTAGELGVYFHRTGLMPAVSGTESGGSSGRCAFQHL
jgi:hypothetical protein